MKDFKFSLIIPHINEGYLLNIMLDSMHNFFAYQNYEIIIVDDGSDDLSDTDFVKNHFLKDKISLYFVKDLWSPNARNFWAAKSNWEYLIFLDSHMYFQDDFLWKLNAILKNHPEIDLLQPVIGSIKDKKMLGHIYKMKNYSLDSTWDQVIDDSPSLAPTTNISGAATIVKKNVFDVCEWFNKFFIKWGCEDLEFSMRAFLNGFSLYFTSDLFVAHYFKSSFTNTQILSHQVLNNKIMFAFSCFSGENQSVILQELQKQYWDELFHQLYAQVLNNKEFLEWNTFQKKQHKYSDEFYMKKFEKYYKNIKT